jgi:hypothetical protein
MTRNNYIFVDFESVQEIDLTLIDGKPVKVFLFFGEQQHKMTVELSMQALHFHAQVEMIKLECTGKNALDFVLAHHTGLKAAADPDGYFHILTRDKGFDALVAHLRSKKILAAREEVFSQIPVLVDLRTLTLTERLERVKTQLAKMKQENKDGRPKKRKSLGSMIHSVFQKQLLDENVHAVICGLEQKRWIKIVEDKVAYQF